MRISDDDVTIFVESTVPAMVRTLFAEAVPEVKTAFLPARIHWTKTHPLLDVLSEEDRTCRPAYEYVKQSGADEIIDWFLPFSCNFLAPSTGRLERLLPHGKRHAFQGPAQIVVSLRDKGFLWWPNQALHGELCARAQARGWNLCFLGTKIERPDWLDELTTTPDVLTALRVSTAAKLFVGTDTGFATIRELLSLPNLYCINEYWWHNVMNRFDYLSWEQLTRSGSQLAFDEIEFIDKLDRMLSDLDPAN